MIDQYKSAGQSAYEEAPPFIASSSLVRFEQMKHAGTILSFQQGHSWTVGRIVCMYVCTVHT